MREVQAYWSPELQVIEKINSLRGAHHLIKEQSVRRLSPHTIPIEFAYAHVVQGDARQLVQLVRQSSPAGEQQLTVYPEVSDKPDYLSTVPAKIKAEWFNPTAYLLPATLHEVKGADFGRGIRDFTLLDVDELDIMRDLLSTKQLLPPQAQKIQEVGETSGKYSILARAYAFHSQFADAFEAQRQVMVLRRELPLSEEERKRRNVFDVDRLFTIKELRSVLHLNP